MVNFLISLSLFFITALLEIGGGYLLWLSIKQKKSKIFGLLGAFILFFYGIIPTLQTANFGKVYAAYGGIFIITSIIWGKLIDRKSPDKYEIFGGLTVLMGVFIIFYSPR